MPPTTRRQSREAAAAGPKGVKRPGASKEEEKKKKESATATKEVAGEKAEEPAPKKTKAEEAEEKTAGDCKVLEKGDTVGDMELPLHDGTKESLEKILKDSGVVIFSYPKANTPGCTKQACGFKDSMEDFSKHSYKVFGVSTDKESAQSNWANKHGFQYKLICDPDRKVLSTFGFVKGGSTLRSHVVIEKGGKILFIERGVKPVDSPTATLAAVTA